MNADVLFEWNQLLQDTITTAPPPLTPRYYSMMHIAMFDAINAVAREYSPYRVHVRIEGRFARGCGGAGDP